VQSISTNGKLVLLVLLGTLMVGVAISLIGLIPEHQELVSLLISDLPAKITIMAVPIILILKSKTYSEWCSEFSNITITKKDFLNASFLELFLSSMLGIPVLTIIWTIAYFVSPGIVDMNEGIGVIGGAFGIV